MCCSPLLLQVCLVGKSRSYQQSEEVQAEEQRVHYVQSRQTCSGVTVQGSNAKGDGDSHRDDTDGTPGSDWGAGFQPREKIETVRNCAALPRDFVDGVVLKVANTLLGLTKDEDGGVPNAWNQGGRRNPHATTAVTIFTR